MTELRASRSACWVYILPPPETPAPTRSRQSVPDANPTRARSKPRAAERSTRVNDVVAARADLRHAQHLPAPTRPDPPRPTPSAMSGSGICIPHLSVAERELCFACGSRRPHRSQIALRSLSDEREESGAKGSGAPQAMCER